MGRRGKVIFTIEGRVNTKIKRIQRHRDTADETKLPLLYTLNSTKEELCLEYVNSFLEQFTAINPKRVVPFMVAENECGVQKFVCTTLRPTLIPVAELYDHMECAAFLAGYIHYEPLDPPEETPGLLSSPGLTLKDHTGDSFDMAMLLCSFLLGAGYDAYVVNGYAPKHVTLRDQSRTPVPLTLTSDTSSKTYKNYDDSDVVEENPYVPIDNSIRPSQFISDEAERKRLASLDPFVLWIPADKKEQPDDSHDGVKRAHAWVLIKAGHREMKESIFIEPTTGRSYALTASPYLGIETMWNHKNFWVNMAVDKKIEDLDFDLNNGEVWEYLFMTGASQGGTGSESKESEEEGFMKDSLGPGTEVPFDCPPMWADALSLDRQSYLLRYPPTGRRTVLHYKSKVDFFARNTQSQGMVMRVTVYHDEERVTVQEVHEWFENRKDKMYKRIRHYLGDKRFVEFYHPGSVGEVKQWLEYPGKKRDIEFYINGRLDRMHHREEIVGDKVSEYYDGRTDLMVFRSVLYTVDKATVGGRQFSVPAGGFLSTPPPGAGGAPTMICCFGLASELYLLKMVTIFDRNPAIPAELDVAKRIYAITEGKLTAYYHFNPGKITCLIKVFNHTRLGVTGTSATADNEVNDEDIDAIQEAATLERETLAQVKLSFQQMQTILKYRLEMEANVINEPTVFEVALNKAETKDKDTEENGAISTGAEAFGSDFLTPFLRSLKDPTRMSREEAMDIRQNCLDSLKARLVERVSIIQCRLNDENGKLARKQEQFQRAQRDGETVSEDYEKYCTEAMFRISVLEKRLAEHEETALKKFSDLDAKLTTDPRLKVLKGTT